MSTKLSHNELLKQIHDTIQSLRVFINNDGGDLHFISFKNGILKLAISGACVGCSSFSITFDQGVREVFLRYRTAIKEFDNVMGGGIVPSSLILLGGAPGIGKSTLMLHISSALSDEKHVICLDMKYDF